MENANTNVQDNVERDVIYRLQSMCQQKKRVSFKLEFQIRRYI